MTKTAGDLAFALGSIRMSTELTPKMRRALQSLCYECNFEDGRQGGTRNFVSRGSLGKGVGKKTIASLQDQGLLEIGPRDLSGKIGYRITELGRATLNTEPPRPPSQPRPKLKPLPPRIGQPKGRFGN